MPSFKDLQYTLRTLRKSPTFTCVVILTMALGIGANTAVFSIVYALLLRPLPYQDSAHIVRLFEARTPNDGSSMSGVAPANFLDWKSQNRAFESVAASVGFHYNLTGAGSPEHVFGNAVSAEWFAVLKAHPLLGRTFLAEEDRAGAAPAVLLSENLWRRRYQADPSILGKTLGVNGDAFTVVGVMPAGTDFNEERQNVELWVPLQRQIRPDRMMWRDSRFLEVIARLKPGVTPVEATEDLNRVMRGIHGEHPGADVFGAAAILPLQKYLTGDMQSTLLVSLGTVALVLLVACANIANLMLVRMTGRTRELAIRMALGATTARLMRQLAAEGVCLGVTAGLLGLGVALAGKKLLLFLLPWVPEVAHIEISVPALLFALAISILTGMIFGLVPALLVVRSRLQDLLRRSSGTATGDTRGRYVRHALAIAEIACSLVLLAGTGLLVRSLSALQHVSLGFATDHRIAVRMSLPRIKYQTDASVVDFYQQVSRKVRALPGVDDAAVAYPLPMDGGHFSLTFTLLSGKQLNDAALRLIDSRYFPVTAIPLL